ncbi:hypothetical protein HMPREF1316_2574 [Olsenella profusa F0195]|uniref:Uncharacterized protein n=1 Tax=Olsenella profusa F0195 TaxID=1125712 RepID=U2TDI8_9ACTN|nr:hypothetical protein HMPREF1316_2574 [Olsenella profusa F0195]
MPLPMRANTHAAACQLYAECVRVLLHMFAPERKHRLGGRDLIENRPPTFHPLCAASLSACSL